MIVYRSEHGDIVIIHNQHIDNLGLSGNSLHSHSIAMLILENKSKHSGTCFFVVQYLQILWVMSCGQLGDV